MIRFDESFSPEYIDGLLEFTGLTLADDVFHDTRLMLEQALGMLQLRVADSVTARAIAEVSEDDEEDGEASSADGDDDDASTAGGDACDKLTWAVLEKLLGFRAHLRREPLCAPLVLVAPRHTHRRR